jgi:hypothetical protein
MEAQYTPPRMVTMIVTKENLINQIPVRNKEMEKLRHLHIASGNEKFYDLVTVLWAHSH